MTEPAPSSPRLAAALEALCLGESPLGIPLFVGPAHAFVQLRRGGALVLLVDARVLPPDEARGQLVDGMRSLSARRVQLVALGAVEDAVLRDLREQVPRPDVQLNRVVDGAVDRLTRAALSDEAASALAASPASLPEPERSTVLAAVKARETEARTDHKAFQARVQGQRPVATIGLLAVLVAIGIAQAATGGWDGDREAALRWGATFSGAHLEAPWTLLSSGLLHADIIHLGMNGYALWLLGGQLERVVGGGRMLAIFTAGVLGGSLAVALATTNPATLGASGGIWALLLAQGWLAFRPGGVLPEGVAVSIRQSVVMNLVINLGISFHPYISMAAHLGGGLGGLALSAAGVLHRGLDVEDTGTLRPTHGMQLLLIGGCALMLLAGFGVALFVGRPWIGPLR